MLFLYISFISCYKKSYKLDSDSKQKLPSYFHFQSKGQYSIDISRSNNNVYPINVDIFICNKNEYKKFKAKTHRYCSIFYNVSLDLNETISKVSGTIKESGPYQIVTISSKYSDQSKVSISLRNPKSYLDAYLQPCLYLEPIFLSLFVIFIILWIINTFQYNFRNFSKCQINFHQILTISYIIIILTSIFEICSLWKNHLYNDDHPYNIIKLILYYLEYSIIFYSIFISAKGLNFSTETVPFCEQSYIIGNLVIVSPLLMGIFNLDEQPHYYYNVFLIILLILIFFSLNDYIKISKRTLAAHLYVIGEEGIDPLSTPIYKKYLQFEKVAVYLKIFYFLTILVIVFCMLSPVYALNLILKDSIFLSFAIPLAWFYQYKKGMKKGYMRIDDIDYDSQPRKISLSTVNKIDLRSFEIGGNENDFDGEKIIWMDGIALPQCPIIVYEIEETNDNDQNKNKKNNDSNVIDNNNKENEDDIDDSIVPQINLESMNDLKI